MTKKTLLWLVPDRRFEAAIRERECEGEADTAEPDDGDALRHRTAL